MIVVFVFSFDGEERGKFTGTSQMSLQKSQKCPASLMCKV